MLAQKSGSELPGSWLASSGGSRQRTSCAAKLARPLQSEETFPYLFFRQIRIVRPSLGGVR
jgi:hypothetical protein